MRLATLLAVSALALLVPGSSRADTPTITAACNGAPCSTGWYTTDVTVTFSVSGSNIKSINCPDTAITVDTAGTDVPCTVTLTDNTISGRVVTIKRDATVPTVASLSLRSPDVNGWYNHPVDVVAQLGTASVSGATCTSSTYSGPDSGSAVVTGTCTSGAGLVSAPRTATIEYDATAPSVSPRADRSPDANGWYNHPVGVSFAGSDAVSGIDSCSTASYSGPDSGSATLSGTCRDKAGNVASASFALKYDATPPAATGASAARPPDADGWYNHPVAVTFAGTDATSGIASCDAPTYGGPNGAAITLSGRCRDNAGNASAPRTFALKYDSTPPTLSALTASPLDRGASLAWKASADTVEITVSRSGGGSTGKRVYAGKPRSTLTDAKLRNGIGYRYTVTALDAAGNAVSRTVAVKPSQPLLAPRVSARVHGAAVLRWRPTKQAAYYNVQLWYRGVKVLSAWPAGASFRVPPTWSYLGRAHRLLPGRYVWYVWPGLGPRSKHRFGPLVGKSTFVVTG